MLAATVTITPETAAFDAAIEALHEQSFGPGRFARAATRIREEGPHDRALSLVACEGETLLGSVRMTPIMAGRGSALLLGPLAVVPAFKGCGIGRTLVHQVLERAAEHGAALVVLVGDEPYYGPLGFSRIPYGQAVMPRPVDPDRFLAHEIVPGALQAFRGAVHHAARVAPLSRST
ncbi:MAG: GNAT family N-acetyltransferase [Mesorhizobium amorphae]|nr:MAG: GNAT family N-acetyltransferase [Mesorhizobium amorphae]